MKTIKITAPEGFKFEECNGNEIELSLVSIKHEIEVGKWYVDKYDSMHLWFTVKFTGTWSKDTFNVYGFDNINTWHNNDERNLSGMIEASTEYVKERLIEEAKKRYKVGDTVQLHVDPFVLTKEHINKICIMRGEKDHIVDTNTYPGNLFVEGQWAKILPPEKKYPTSVDEVEGRTWYISSEGPVIEAPIIGSKDKNNLSSKSRAKAFLALI